MTYARSVSAAKPDAVRALSNRPKTVIGVVHAPALPGSPAYVGTPMEEIYEAALADAGRYARGGVDALIIENHGDIPFSRPDDLGPETGACLAVMVDRVRRAVDLPVGVNVLANGANHALAVAKAAGASFVRVNQWANAYVANEGILEGPAAAATRYRAWLHGRGIKVFADVHAKHGAHAIVADRTIPELTRDAEFFDADAVIVTGQRTGDAARVDEVREVANATNLPVLIGSGATEDNVAGLLEVADGVIAASSLKEDGVWWSPVSEAKVRSFMAVVRTVEADGRR